jgi:hypothetical protein
VSPVCNAAQCSTRAVSERSVKIKLLVTQNAHAIVSNCYYINGPMPVIVDPMFPPNFTTAERKLIRRLRTPDAVQRWLNSLPYNTEKEAETMRTFRGVVRTGSAHCLEAALSAAVILEQHGFPPLVLSFESVDQLDHVLFIYRTPTGWGSVARSRDPGLHGRKPVFRTPRALVMSYAEGYVDYTGRIKGYAVVDLRVLGSYEWRLSDRNVWRVERLLVEIPHRSIVSSDARHLAMRRRYRQFREEHGHKPWKYFSGQWSWTPLPAEFRRRG